MSVPSKIAGRVSISNVAWKEQRPSRIAKSFPNPQPNPQNAMSCTTCAVSGSPRVLVSCCKTSPRCAVTAEAAGPAAIDAATGEPGRRVGTHFIKR
jgi:hypothetical protein